MGSWNGTCMISNLPILSGDKVKLIILHSNRMSNSEIIGQSAFTYHNDILTPSFLPLTGMYSDCGLIDNIRKDWNYNLIENYLKIQLSDTIFIDGKEYKNWKLEDVLYGIERGNITYPSYNNKEKDTLFDYTMKKSDKMDYTDSDDRRLMLSFVLIREDIWYYINNNYNGSKFNFEREEGEDFNIDIDDYLIKQYKKHLNSNLKLKEIENDDSLSDSEKVVALMRFSWDGQSNIFYSEYHNYIQLLAKNEYTKYFKNNEDKQDQIFEYWSQLAKIHEFLSDSRKSWMIQSGAGSQEANYDINRFLSDCIIDICDNIKEIDE